MVTGEHGLDLSAGGSSMTFFVPTDAAFQELGAGTVESALKNPVLLKTVTNYIIDLWPTRPLDVATVSLFTFLF